MQIQVLIVIEGDRMALQKFTQAIAEQLADKDICCFEKYIPCMDELCDRYNVLSRITCIVDENSRNFGVFSYRGREIAVYGMEHLQTLDWGRTVVLINSGYHEEAYEKLRAQLGEDTKIYYFESRETQIEMHYRQYYEASDLQDIILFRSGPHASGYVRGMDFADNARALFEYMLAHHYNEQYELVWLVKNPQEFAAYHDIKKVSFLSFDWSASEVKDDRDAYYRVLCLAKYIFFTDAYGFARNCRRDQIRVQLWHGCGFKTRVNFVRCEKRYEYTTVISELYSKIHQDIYGLRKEQMLVTGYAKQDWLFHPAVDWQDRLGIPMSRKYIFWLPTFRTAKEQLSCLNEYEFDNQTGLPVASTYEMLLQLDELLRSLDIVLVLKLHPFQDVQKIGRINMRNIVVLDNGLLVENDIQINQLLGNADALISDYSSAAVDYMLLDRPIAFTLDDVEAYGQSRGFVFEHIREWLPGMELLAFEDMCQFAIEVGTGNDSTKEKRRELIRKMHKYQDDRNCTRILEALQL